MVNRVRDSLTGDTIDLDDDESITIKNNGKRISLLKVDYFRIKDTERFANFWL